MPLSLHISADREKTCLPLLRRAITQAHRMLRSPIREVSIALIPAAEMSRLHRKYKNLSCPTDVLTFELDRDGRDRPVAGEIVICTTVARARARSLRHPVCHELLLYALHGFLHLSGFDDRTASAFLAMHAKEDEILTRLGIGPVFNPRARSR